MALPPNEMCPGMAHTTLLTSLCFTLITICLMYLFWKNRQTPAFKSRRPIMTMSTSICIILAMSLPVLAAYNICNSGELQHTLYFNISSASIYTYALWLITYRTWVLFINWNMAISQLDEASSSEASSANIWRSIHKYFASKLATYIWCIILTTFIIIEMSVADTDIYFHENNIGPWIIRSCFFLWMLISLILVITARSMRDHFFIMLEMKIYIVLVVFMVTAFIYVGEVLPTWAPQYSPPQLVQIKILLNVIRSGVSVVLFMGFPVFKFRFKFRGILLDHNLFEEASNTRVNNSVVDLIKVNSIDAPTMHSVLRNSSTSIKICNRMHPTMLAFLSKNKKCYDEFRKHLVACLAVENLLFFTEAQTFRLHVKLAMQAKMDSLCHQTKVDIDKVAQNENDTQAVDETSEQIMKLDFFYLQKSGGMSFKTTGIKENWLMIYDKFVLDSSPLQINVDSETFESLHNFRGIIVSSDSNVDINEYFESFQNAMLKIWWLMESLYLHFQISDEYRDIIKSHFPIYQKYNDNFKSA